MQPIMLEYSVDILEGIRVIAMPSLFAMGDKMAHILRIRVKAGKQAVDLAGWAVTATMVRRDQTTVLVTGEVVENAAEVVLEAACYAQSGSFTLSVALCKGEQLITIFCGMGDVTRTRTDSFVDPGHAIPSVDEIIAQYGLMKTAVQNTDTAAGRANDAASRAEEIANTVQEKLNNGELTGPQGPIGPSGNTGETGPKGEKGDKGDLGKDAAIDATLTQAGQAADAKQVGDAMRAIHEELDEKVEKVHQNILIGSESGASVSVSDAFAAPICGLNLYGRSTQDGTPSPDNPVPIVSAGSKGTLAVKVMNKNLFNYLAPPDEDKGWYGGEYAIKEDILTVTAKHGWHIYWYKNPAPKKTTTVSLAYRQKDSTTSGNTYHSFAIVKSDDKSYPTKGDQYIVDEPEPATEWKKVTGTIEPSEYIGIFICLQNENAEEYREIEIKDMQIELGSTATEYKPYHEKNLILQTPDGIRGIQTLTNGNYVDETGQKWICDEIDLERGVKIQRIGRAKLNRVTTTVDPQWYDSDQSYSYEITLFDDYKFYDSYAEPNEGYDLCDHFQTYSFSDFYRKNIETGLLAGHSYVVVNISKSLNIGATVDEFKTWFNEHVILYKRLQTPIETPLTDEEIAAYKALVAYAPNTTVQVEDGAEIKLNYQRDVNIAIKALEDAIASMTND